MRVILHIGQHKTGSKALQSALYANQTHLAERRMAYPVPAAVAGPLRPWQMNHHTLFETVRSEARGLASETSVRACLERMRGASETAADTMILSSEDLFDMHTAHDADFHPELVAAGSRTLARELAGFATSVDVVCYLRRQDHLLAAHYAQFIKGSSTHHPTFAEFQAAFAPRLDYDAILAHWEAAFGADAVTIAAYEPAIMPGGIVADFFRRALGLEPPAVTAPYPDDLEAVNVTPSRDHVEYMRHLNRRSSLGLPVVPREHVLESAFRDRVGGAVGIAAWMSPGARVALLRGHEAGNRRIAARHGIRGDLFVERPPAASDPWDAPQPPGLQRLVALDTMVRAVASQQREVRRGWAGRMRRRPRRAIWVVSPHATPADETLAAELFSGIAGHPDLDSVILRELDLAAVLSCRHRVSLVVLIGPTVGGWIEAVCGAALRCARTRVVRVLGGVIHGTHGLHAATVDPLFFAGKRLAPREGRP